MAEREDNSANGQGGEDKFAVHAPSITLPKGGGAISGIGEKFGANPVTGTGSMTVPIATSPGRGGVGPQLSLAYDTGSGNGPFGSGWSLSLPSITRRTDKGLPRYADAEESDVFILSGVEDLVPVLAEGGGGRAPQPLDSPDDKPGYWVRRYRPRIEGPFARIERWTDKATGVSHWRSVSKDNITVLYGKTDESRIADPSDPRRVYSWLISESWNAKGDAILYRYKPEDAVGVDHAAAWEKGRLAAGKFPQRYLKSILYGNARPCRAEEDLTRRTDWLFEAVLDYGEHDDRTPTTAEVRAWPVRQDPFSRLRSTFDVRIWRLCRRVLMFHHFPDELGLEDCLVRSTDIDYQEGTLASFVAAIEQAGYAGQPDGTYFRKALPKLEFTYTEARVDETVRDVDPDSLQNLPAGVDGVDFQWLDLDSEGLTGVLAEQAGGWWYKRNLGDGTFGPSELVARRPSSMEIGAGRAQFIDLAGEGRLDLVSYDRQTPGFYERTADRDWRGFMPFRSAPNLDTKDPNLRFVDVTGDGFPDILVSEDRVFTWYESRLKQGFAPAQRTPKAWDEEQGPELVFADPTQSIFLADMAGDGLSDIVRIRSGEVCYWPNLGYGCFGAKIVMGAAPRFDSRELFDPRRIRLADIDGSGASDIIYVGRDGVSLWFNQSGNSWSAPHRLDHFPIVDSLTSLAAVDLLGAGTACLVWSSPLRADAGRPMRYIDLMGGQKPHLLVRTTNNMGAETEVRYAASTKFYLQDRREGRPWVTRLPFPVHVVERVETRDLVSNTRLVSTYRYSHGYYDGVEREFRGFAYVEQRDVESVKGLTAGTGDAFDLPPVVSKTWYHNGAFLEEGRIEAWFKTPAHREWYAGDPSAAFLPEPPLPAGLKPEELREAARAMKGSVLRREIYAEDGSPEAAHPYSVSEQSYRVVCLQPRGPNRHAVFFTHAAESLDYHYERNPADPRVGHTLTLEVDDYGDVLKSVAIGYPRRQPVYDEQGRTLATLTENSFTNAIDQDDAWRAPLLAETRAYALTAPGLAGPTPLSFAEVSQLAAASEIPNEQHPSSGEAQKRLLGRVRTLYRKDDLSGLSPLGTVESLALPGEAYKLAVTPGLLGVYDAKATASELQTILTVEGGYRDLDGDGQLWAPSGRAFYSSRADDTPVTELLAARQGFFQPRRFRDPFGAEAVVAYDAYHLSVASATDAVGNTTSSSYDYRALLPQVFIDPNGNRALARYDALGMLAGTALCGKADGPLEGDSFDNFTVDLAPADIAAFFDASDPRALAAAHLGTATTRIVYNLDRAPACAASIARETHVSHLAPGAQTKVQLRVVYSDGFGREAQTKVQAEPGPLDLADPDSPVADPRWVGTGAKVYNNKGKPIREYEPFFSATPRFDVEKWGVCSTLFYDPLGRVLAALRPNHTWEKVVLDPWSQAAWDVNDTVTRDPGADPQVGGFFARLPDADYLPTWYAQRTASGVLAADNSERDAAAKAAAQADTPTVVHFDTLGRPFLSIADNGKDAEGADRKYETWSVLDIQGRLRAIRDALGRTVMRYDYDLPGARIHQASMEAGERWNLGDVAGKSLRAWNSRNYAFRTEYDSLRRPLRSWVGGGDPAEPNAMVMAQEILFERNIFGDSAADTGLSDAQLRQANLKTKIWRHFDSAGVLANDSYDFKGNLLGVVRRFASDHKTPPDWSQDPALESEAFASANAYDALNRVIAATTPDDSVYRPSFNEAGLLEAVDVALRGAEAVTPFVTNIDYDAKGRRTRIDYSNGATTTYAYDPDTFRLVNLRTTRNPASGGARSQIFSDPCIVQNLHYTYDPVGNITRMRDAAIQTVFNGQKVEPVCDYTYDPLYRLVRATGREHAGQSAFAFTPPDGNFRDYPFVGASSLNDLQNLRNCLETYSYDAVGNFQSMAHVAGSGGSGNWTRRYAYCDASLIEPSETSNRLSRTLLPTAGAVAVEPYVYDAHGDMVRMPHLSRMQWDFSDRLVATSQQVVNDGTAETTYYVYDSAGQRTRKITEGRNGNKTKERLYVGGFEIFREFDGSNQLKLERQTLNVMDDTRRIVLVDTRTDQNAPPENRNRPVWTYELGDHLGSSCVQLSPDGAVISYEAYAPYGSTVFQAFDHEASLKRYRFSSRERDEESGFNYHGARYYAPWLGRWTGCDPAGLVDGTNLFAFGRCNPIRFADPGGMECDPQNASCSVDPTEPTPREEALQTSLPEDERYLPAQSENSPPASNSSQEEEPVSRQVEAPAQQDQADTSTPTPAEAAYAARVARYQAIFAEERSRGWWDRTFHRNTPEEREAHQWLAATNCPECDPTAPPEVIADQLASYRLGLGLIGASNAATMYAIHSMGAPPGEPTLRAPIAAADEGEASGLAPLSSLSRRQAAIHDLLPEPGAYTLLRKRSVSMSDLRAIGQVTGDEYNMFTNRGQRLIVRGSGNTVSVSEDMLNDILAGRYGKYSGHTHPPGYEISPSIGDRNFLMSIGQDRSGIWGDSGVRVFGGTPGDDARIQSDITRAQMIRLYGGN